MGGTVMNKYRLVFSVFSVLLLTGCTTNEANIAETTADSFNETPVITEEVLENSQVNPELSSNEVVESSLVESSLEEVSDESDSLESSEEIKEVVSESVEEVLEDEPTEVEIFPIPEGIYTNYELEGQLIEDVRVNEAILAVVTYLKENNHYFDSAEYHFKVSQLVNTDLIELSVAEQYSDGEIIRGVFDYNLEEKSIETIHK